MIVDRRRFLAAAANTAIAATPVAAVEWRPSQRYPDPRVEALDESFAKYSLALAKVERLADGMRWSEGPAWFGDVRCLLWSDIPNDRMLKWEEETGVVSVFRRPSNHSNGNTRDRQGRLITCEHLTRRVTRTEYDGSITTIASHFEGKRLNSPNDVVCKSDGTLWFTDPPFGLLGYYEGELAEPQLPTNVYRWDPHQETLTVVIGDVERPNGLAFSPDESKLYVVEGGVTPRVIRAYDLTKDGRRLVNGRVLITAADGGTPDGMRVDMDGNLWIGWGMGSAELDGVAVFNPQGKQIGRIRLPERCGNLCFGGRHRNRLFMCGSTSIYSLYVNTQGSPGG